MHSWYLLHYSLESDFVETPKKAAQTGRPCVIKLNNGPVYIPWIASKRNQYVWHITFLARIQNKHIFYFKYFCFAGIVTIILRNGDNRCMYWYHNSIPNPYTIWWMANKASPIFVNIMKYNKFLRIQFWNWLASPNRIRHLLQFIVHCIMN